MRKLRKLLTEALKQSCPTEDESQISKLLEQKINSSSSFVLEGKYVRFVAKQANSENWVFTGKSACGGADPLL